MGDDSLEQLPGLAGRADDEPFSVAQELGLGHPGHPLEIFQVAETDQMIEARLVLGKKENMAGVPPVQAAAGAQLSHHGVDLRHPGDAPLLQHGNKAGQEIAAGDGVVGCPVVLEIRQTQGVGDEIELVFAQIRQQVLRQDQGVEIRRRVADPLPLAGGLDKADVKIRIVGAQGQIAAELQKFRQHLLDLRGVAQHGIGDAGEVDDFLAQSAVGVHKGLEPLTGLAVPEDDRADLGDALGAAGEARRLQVEGDEVPPQRQVPHAVDDDAVVHVVDIISLAAVEDLHRLVRPGDGAAALDGVHRVGVGLGDAVVRDADGRHAPGGGLAHGQGRIRQGVHGGHVRM